MQSLLAGDSRGQQAAAVSSRTDIAPLSHKGQHSRTVTAKSLPMLCTLRFACRLHETLALHRPRIGLAQDMKSPTTNTDCSAVCGGWNVWAR